MADVETGELPFSKVVGFRLEDFDTTCPVVSERQCPEKIALVSAYTSSVVNNKDGLSEGAEQDRLVCGLKLREYSLYAKVGDCAVAADICPTRERMNESAIRGIGVIAARKFMGIFGVRGH